MYDFLDKIGLKAVLEAIKGKMPTSLPANGGNADTVGGHTVGCNVPADAKFTDTVIDASLFADKAFYGDTTINVGRKADSAVGPYSAAEGKDTIASGYYSHAEGAGTTASGSSSHAEGLAAKADGPNSHAEGDNTTASGTASHAEGYYTIAKPNAYYSHAEGYITIAGGAASHAEGYYTIANNVAEHASGKYNVSNEDTLFSVGDGKSSIDRHNAFEITKTGGKLHDKDIATTDLIPTIPTSLPANGGNADTVNGLKIKSMVLNGTTNADGVCQLGMAIDKYQVLAIVGNTVDEHDLVFTPWIWGLPDPNPSMWGFSVTEFSDPLTRKINIPFSITVYYVEL